MRSHIARFRTHLGRALASVGVEYEGPRFSSLHSIRVLLTFVRIAVQEMAPEHLRGYGALKDEAIAEVRGLCSELEGLLRGFEHSLALGEAADLQARLDRLQRTARETELLRTLDRIVNENELAEFRPSLLSLLEKLESREFEIAVFGRISSGKSSLLNLLLETDILPVGVNPITAVPTRLVYGDEPRFSVTFADRQVKDYPLGDLPQFASEESNRGNHLGVTRLVVRLASSLLRDGLVLVDTPGLGALASAGAEETRAYLPQCDLGILLISAVTPIDEEDLNTIHALSLAAIPVMVLLSKADLVGTQELAKALDYTEQEIAANLNLRVAVCPVSTANGYEHLLEAWFRDQFAPLRGRHRELAQESVRRKAGALTEAVLSALRSLVDASASTEPTNRDRLEKIERRLRDAAGGIESVRRYCLSATDEIRSHGPVAIGKAVSAAVRDWSGEPSLRAGPAVSGALEVAAVHAAAEISKRLSDLAHDLDSTLTFAARQLGGPIGDGLTEDLVREMPRFEVALPEDAASLPWFRAVLPSLAQAWAGRTLGRILQQSVDSAFVSYGRSLQTWSGRVLSEMQSHFEAQADAYRAQLARLSNRTALDRGAAQRMQAEIASLEAALATPGEQPGEMR